MKYLLVALLLLFLHTSAVAQACNWCGMQDAPDSVSWSTHIPPPDEPGERLIVTGTVYQEDGHMPAASVMLYVYHTNIEGVYPRRVGAKDNARYHGYLRGWMETDAEGRYRFETIRPAPYETHGGEPAHIHYTIQPPGQREYWINAAWFSDDPRVTPDALASLKRVGGETNVMDVWQDNEGTWHGSRDIILAVYD